MDANGLALDDLHKAFREAVGLGMGTKQMTKLRAVADVMSQMRENRASTHSASHVKAARFPAQLRAKRETTP